MHGFSGLEGVSDVIRCLGHFGSPIEEKASDLGGLEGLESLAMHGFSGLEGVADVIRGLSHFGSPIEEKVSDLGSLEDLESLEMYGFSGLRREGVRSRKLGRLRKLGNAWIFRSGRGVGCYPGFGLFR